MAETSQIPLHVSKESIASLHFPSNEVLDSELAIKNRHKDLERATTLGNIEHSKIKIVFEDSEGLKQVETTIWATTDRFIVLKGGRYIPINSIIEVG